MITSCVKNIFFNQKRYCADWAKAGECQRNPAWMLKGCPVACKECKNKCADHNANCDAWKKTGECKRNASYMNIYCARVIFLITIEYFTSHIFSFTITFEWLWCTPISFLTLICHSSLVDNVVAKVENARTKTQTASFGLLSTTAKTRNTKIT